MVCNAITQQNHCQISVEIRYLVTSSSQKLQFDPPWRRVNQNDICRVTRGTEEVNIGESHHRITYSPYKHN